MFDPETGRWQLHNGDSVDFLPALPANSPPHELVSTAEPDESSSDGFAHYLVGGDAEVVKQIVDFYERKGTPVPAGYADAAAAHAAKVEAEAPQPEPAPEPSTEPELQQ